LYGEHDVTEKERSREILNKKGAALLILLIAFVLTLHFGPEFIRNPIPINLQIAGNEVHVADTWQEWEVHYEDGSVETPRSDSFPVNLRFQVTPKMFGANSYAKIGVPVYYRGGLEFPYGVNVRGSVDLYIGQKNLTGKNFLGTALLSPLEFVPSSKIGTYRAYFWVCGKNAYDTLLASWTTPEGDTWSTNFYNPLWATAYQIRYGNCFINIQDILDKLAWEQGTFQLECFAKEQWYGYQWPWVAFQGEHLSAEVEVIFGAPFTVFKSDVVTGTTITTGIPTATFWITSRTLIVVSVTYTYTRSETTIIGKYTTITVTATTLTTGTVTTGTLPPPPIPIPDWWKIFVDWFKSLLPAWLQPYWWVVLIAVAIIVILFLRWLLRPKVEIKS